MEAALFCPFCGAPQEKESSVEKGKANRRPKTRANGLGTAYKRTNRGRDTWTACVITGWRFRDGDPSLPKVPVKKTKGGFATRRDALNYCASLRQESSTRKRVTLEELWLEWSKGYSGRVGSSTFAQYSAIYNKHLHSLQGSYLDQISLNDLQQVIDNAPGHRTKQTGKTVIGLLWRYAVAHDLADRDISQTLYTGKGQSVQREPLTSDEIKRIRENIGKIRYAEYIYVLSYLGCRPGEMLELKKDQLHHYIRKEKDGTVAADIWYIIGGKKTDAGRDRIIPIHSLILPYVLDRALVPGTDLLFPQYQFDRKGEKFLYFKPMSDEYMNKHVFKPMAKKLGIPEHKTPYSTRHSFGDMLKNADGSDKMKAALIGHSDYAFTQDRYQSTTIEELAALVASLE